MTNKYGLHGKLTTTAENREKLASILLQAAQLVSTAKGCHLYLVSTQEEEDNTVWVTEVWDSKEDHDISLHVAGVRELISEAMPLLSGKPEKGQVFQVLGGVGIE